MNKCLKCPTHPKLIQTGYGYDKKCPVCKKNYHIEDKDVNKPYKADITDKSKLPKNWGGTKIK